MNRITLALLAAALLFPAPASSQEVVRKPTFEVYGFAQVDLIQDFQRVRPDWNATLRPTRIPTVEGLYGANGESIVSARQSRLGVRGARPFHPADAAVASGCRVPGGLGRDRRDGRRP